MAKKKPAATTAAPKGRKKTVSVKKIVAEIDRTLAKLEPKATAAKKSAAAGTDPQAYALDRAILSLRGARDVMKGVCVPGFDIPI
jgi:hypothetical protein